LDPVLTQLWAETPTTNGSTWTTQAGVLFCLGTQCQVIAAITFVSRDDIESMQDRMKASFDEAKDMAADEMDNIVYNQLVDLGAKLARFLADAALTLPIIVYYQLRPMPVLTLANRIYADASRDEELIADNKVVHPAFVQSVVRALSS
jgi:prophage DNA circulation protein